MSVISQYIAASLAKKGKQQERQNKLTQMLVTLSAIQGGPNAGDALSNIKDQIESAYGKDSFDTVQKAVISGNFLAQMGLGRQGQGQPTPAPTGMTEGGQPMSMGEPGQFDPATAPMQPQFPGKPVPRPEMRIKSMNSEGDLQFEMYRGKSQAQAVMETKQFYDGIIQTNPNLAPKDAWVKALDLIEDKYGFIPPTAALKLVEPDFIVARDKKWFKDYFQSRNEVLSELTNGKPESATPQQRHLVSTLTAQALATEGHTPNIPEARALIFGDALGVGGNLDPKLKTELAAQGIDPNRATSSQIRTAINTMTERNIQAEWRKQKGTKAIGIALDARKEVGPALTILSEIGDLLFGAPLPEDMNLPEGQRRRTAPLLQEQGGIKRFYHGLTRSGQAFWQDSEIGQRAATYKRARKAFLAKIVRAFGEKGTLNEGDIQRMVDLLPTLFTTEAVARASLTMMDTILVEIGNRTAQDANAITVQQGMDLIEKYERNAFGKEFERATGENLTPEELDDLRPADIIELDDQGNIISGELIR